MIVYDPIHGQYQVPAHLLDLLQTPEVLRLSQIHLLNTPSASQAALGDVRRFSHTLGVLALALHCPSQGFTDSEWRAFHAAVLLHDIGTPPFGHLLEYHLRERGAEWNHEAMIANVLRGTHAPENRSHQIFMGRAIEFAKLLKHNVIDREVVRDIVERHTHPLSQLLFGSIDLDNIDNVLRMAWGLGIEGWKELGLRLVSHISVGSDGQVQLGEDPGRPLVRQWCSLRRKVYEVLTFDPIAISAQAVLSEAVGKLLEAGAITSDDWSLTDEQLVERLRTNTETKHAMLREYYGKLPLPVFCMQLSGKLDDYRINGRLYAKDAIETVLAAHFPNQRVLGYTIIDRGSFEKALGFVDPDSDEAWNIGATSASVVLYGFLRGTRSVAPRKAAETAQDILSLLGVPSANVMRLQADFPGLCDNAQGTFSFATA